MFQFNLFNFSQFSRQCCCFFAGCIMCLMIIFMPVQADCPSETTGFLGNVGTTSGNCPTMIPPPGVPLPPLDAFGSVSVNQNGPLASVNRLNPTQMPTTNNWQLFQNPCGINQNLWVDGGPNGIFAGAGGLRMRTGAFLVGMARTGPTAIVAQHNMNQNVNFPNLIVDNRLTFLFSATETNGTANDYFSVSTEIFNSETCYVTYTPNNTALTGKIVDYNITGNVFHDVYYENLTPALAISASPLTLQSVYVLLSIDGQPIHKYPLGTLLPRGTSFQFFAPRAGTLGPETMVLYAVNANDTGIVFRLPPLPALGQPISGKLFTATEPFTGFLRLAPLSTNNPTPSLNVTWIQSSFFMPEDVFDGADTSCPCPAPPQQCTNCIFPCAIDNPTCPSVKPTSPSWWNLGEVDAIALTGMSFYMRLPVDWAQSFRNVAFKMIGANWTLPVDPNIPSPVGLSIILPAISMADKDLANTYYCDLFKQQNPSCTITPPCTPSACPCTASGCTLPYHDPSNYSSNLFLLRFDMFMANNLNTITPTINVPDFQNLNRQLANYIITAPCNNLSVYNAHRLYIPESATISITNNRLKWTYTLQTKFTPPGLTGNKILMCFPFWKFLEGTGAMANQVNTVPGGGQPLQNFIFNDTIKGTLYAAECNNGVVNFLENTIPSWYGIGVGQDLFIPPDLTFTSDQLAGLDDALFQIEHEDYPLPFFPEPNLDPGYIAGQVSFMLAKSALYIAYYLEKKLAPLPTIIARTQRYVDNAKSCISAYLLGRTPDLLIL